METLRNGHGELSITATAETTIVTQDVFVKAAGTTVLSANAHNWSMPANNRLRYDGVADRVVHVAVTVSMSAAGNNELFRGAIAKNGTVLTESEVDRWISTGTDIGSTALHAFTTVSTNDYIEMWMANGTNTTNMTLETMNLFVMDMAV